jgi:assimilatory nitrate reductase catalytic subunit
MEDGRVKAALFADREPVALSRTHVAGQLGTEGRGILAGRPGGDMPDPGPIVCACLSVGVNTILTGIETQGLMTVEAIGAALGAGITCGSCRPEIARLLATATRAQAAE